MVKLCLGDERRGGVERVLGERPVRPGQEGSGAAVAVVQRVEDADAVAGAALVRVVLQCLAEVSLASREPLLDRRRLIARTREPDVAKVTDLCRDEPSLYRQQR